MLLFVTFAEKLFAKTTLLNVRPVPLCDVKPTAFNACAARLYFVQNTLKINVLNVEKLFVMHVCKGVPFVERITAINI